MISVAKVQRRNAWRYYVRGVAFGDGRRPVGQALKDAQEMAGLPPGVWRGRGVAALGLAAGQTVTERQMELLFGEGRHPDADRMERELLDDGEDPETARLATGEGQVRGVPGGLGLDEIVGEGGGVHSAIRSHVRISGQSEAPELQRFWFRPMPSGHGAPGGRESGPGSRVSV
ncbi:relaxase domain-containing protein [Streptomyces sp. NPDC059582]|uniref:relaxase domain-containing protein n=1 Tax=Streptomyces sp. NPDC059582 TaxID=3346875 RepID=UPI0036950B70